jgi:hypothetical protein
MTPINVAIDTPASKIKLFITVIIIIGVLAIGSFFMIKRSRRTDPPPHAPSPDPTLGFVVPPTR